MDITDATVPPASDVVGDPSGLFRVALPNFEGPLDLLLHLIREHRIDIFDIPIALILEKYLQQLERMMTRNLDIASEFLVMVATLAHIKSRLLLPKQEAAAQAVSDLSMAGEERGDPRAELVRRLLEYQKYKEAAEQLGRQDVLDRDTFCRRVALEKTPIPDEEVGLTEMSVYRLIEALSSVLKSLEPKLSHEVVRDRVKLSDAMREIGDQIREKGSVGFSTLFKGVQDRHRVVITFLAILEMCRLQLIQVSQEELQGEILLCERASALSAFDDLELGEQDEYR
jgi:segregation and condensation protein A